MIYGNNKNLKCPTSWWLQPIWKTLVKFGSFPQVGVKKKNVWNHHLDSDFVSWWQQIRLQPEFLGFFFPSTSGPSSKVFFCEKLSWRDEGLSVVAATPPRKISKILIWEVFRSFVIFHPAGLWMLTVHIACNLLTKPYYWVISFHTLLKHDFNHCSSWISSSKIPQELRTIQ